MPELDRLVLVAVLALGALVLLPAAARGAGRRRQVLAAALGRGAQRLRETGPAVVGRRAAAALLGSASALLVIAAPARAAAPDRTVATTGPLAAEPRQTPRASRVVEVVVVRPGDTLWDIARRHLPARATDAQVARAWPRWYAANRAVIGPDPDVIRPGQRLRAPSGTAAPRLAPATPSGRAPSRSAPATAFDPDRAGAS
ncbi:MAG: LysM domain-containing protein [Candidatus Nanopelagicales bacterium]